MRRQLDVEIAKEFYNDKQVAEMKQLYERFRKGRSLVHKPVLLCYEYNFTFGEKEFIQKSYFEDLNCVGEFVEMLHKLEVEIATLALAKKKSFKMVILAHNGHRYDDIFLLPQLHR